MPTDIRYTNDGIQFTDTNDLSLRDGEDNAKSLVATSVKGVVRDRTPIRTRTERSRLVAALRDELRGHTYIDDVGEITVERNDDGSLTVTLRVGSDDIEVTT